MLAPARPPPSSPRVRLTWTMSNPPEPRPRSSGLGVDDHLVADRHLADQRACRPRPGGARRPTRPSAGRSSTTMPRRRFSIGRPPPRSIASQTASIWTIRSAATLSSGVWFASVPLASSTHLEPGRRERVRVAAAARRDLAGLDATALERGPRDDHRPRARGQPVTAEHLGHLDVDVALVLAGRPGAGVHHRADRLLARSSSRLRASPSTRQWPGTTFEAVPPRDHADVRRRLVVEPAELHRSRSPPRRPAMALRPSSGRIPEWASMPSNSAASRL